MDQAKYRNLEVYDLVCVGFGPASLSIAIALDDRHKERKSSDAHAVPPKVLFLEKKLAFGWHTGMLLEDSRMQISFIKDLVTLRNPKSPFTFMNYLHTHSRLADFANLNTFSPFRSEFGDYLRWCAAHFIDDAAYGQEVLQVIPEDAEGDNPVRHFIVKSRNVVTGLITYRKTRRVVIATGARPHLPDHYPKHHPRVVHSSEFLHRVPGILEGIQRPRIAVVGSGQSAAEIFDYLRGNCPVSTVNLLIRGQHLRPSDDSPFVNEIFNASKVDEVYHRSLGVRSRTILDDKNTNYGVVRVKLLERIYESLYRERLGGNPAKKPMHQILNFRSVVAVNKATPDSESLCLTIQILPGSCESKQDLTTMEVDLLIAATGYKHGYPDDILDGCASLISDEKGGWRVDRDYRLMFDEGKVSRGAGIWLQGCNEATHGLSDSLLSVMATRSAEVVASMFGCRTAKRPTYSLL
ncbi:IucD, Lysine-ornithine N-monooxygenase [Pyrenophora tritici-repentis]|uniref:L-ornithine N(5)-monooxygenase [NAD(P)H] n=1 Tax=Pyrenophora tritici-repentis TaxID=45151 RepID=A0A834VTW6_9PLEO|nr:IucD, Lysine-ornithine N-monooxygenase [Pyrenophora tritici-repentis]KAI1507555.1 l-ornithine n5-oxygenase [Pyrenophora tritici-repentis]